MASEEMATTTSSSSSFAFGLFDTLVPVSSIVTVSVLVGCTLPHSHTHGFGLFILIWWTAAVAISLNDCFVQNTTKSDDSTVFGVMILLGMPVFILTVLYAWFTRSFTVRKFIMKDVPVWALVALHVYRLDGLSLITPFFNRTVPKFVGFQTIVLDVLIGATSVPLAWVLYHRRKTDRLRGNLLFPVPLPLKDVILFWNSLGLYDVSSAYLIFILNCLGVGGELIVDPPLSKVVVFHPLPLLILFQMTLAFAIHVLLLLYWNEMIEWQSSDLPFHTRQLRKAFR